LSLEKVLGRPLAALDEALEQRARELGLSTESVHANGEAGLLEALLERSADLHGVIVNPGSLAPIAYALADALEALELRAVEVQLGHETRSRGKSALRRVVDKQFHGHGAEGYFKALASFSEATTASSEAKVTDAAEPESSEAPNEETPARQANGKTIGRRKPAAENPAPGKSIGRAKPATTANTNDDGPKGKSIGRSGNNWRYRFTLPYEYRQVGFAGASYFLRFSADGSTWFKVGQGAGPAGGAARTVVSR